MTKVDRILTLSGKTNAELSAIAVTLGEVPSAGVTKDELIKLIMKHDGINVDFNFSSPWFNLVAAIVAIIMAGFSGFQFWGALIAITVLVIDVVRTIRKAKAAGKTRKDWQEVAKEIIVEIFAIIAVVIAVLATDMLFLIFGALMLAADALIEVKRS